MLWRTTETVESKPNTVADDGLAAAQLPVQVEMKDSQTESGLLDEIQKNVSRRASFMDEDEQDFPDLGMDLSDDREFMKFTSKLGGEMMNHRFAPDILRDVLSPLPSALASDGGGSSSISVSFAVPSRQSQLSTYSSPPIGSLLPPHPDEVAELLPHMLGPDLDFIHSTTSLSLRASATSSLDHDDDPGQDHAFPDNPTMPLSEAPPWRPQNQPSTCEFTHTILNYSQKRESGCKKAEYSATTVDNFGNRWRLIVYVNGNGRASNHHLSLFLQVADAEELSFGWKKNVSYVLTLEHPSGPHVGYAKRNPDKTFKLCPKAIDWGWSQFITSDRIQQEGYISNDSLTVRAHVTVKTSSVSIDPDDSELYLKCAVEEGNVGAVETCLAQGASVNCQFKDDLYTPLHTACSASASEESLNVLRFLLQKGADCNACNKWRETPLLIAANNGHTNAVEALLSKGANPTLCSEAGWSALTFASHKGYDDIVSLLIDAHAPVNCRVTEDLSTPLHKACAGGKPGHLNCVVRLIAAGADVHALNKWKETPLLTAANHGQTGTVEALLNAGADPCKCTDTGWSPLSIAAYKGHDDVVRLLLERGAPTEEEDPTLSALLQAATKGLPSTVELLLRHGADHTVTTKKGDTALSILVEQNLIDTAVEMVTEYKASIPRCSRDRKKVQRARLLINLRVKQQQKEGMISLDSEDYSDRDELDDDSNAALHDSSGSPNVDTASKRKKKMVARKHGEKSIENAEAEAKAAAEALLLELEEEDAKAQKDEAVACSKRNKKKKKKERERYQRLEEERLRREKEQQEEERLKQRRLQDEKERKEKERKEQIEREKELREAAEQMARAAAKKKEKEEEERTRREQEKKERDKSTRQGKKIAENLSSNKSSSSREPGKGKIDKKVTTTANIISPYAEKVGTVSPKPRDNAGTQGHPILPKSSHRLNTNALQPRSSMKSNVSHTSIEDQLEIMANDVVDFLGFDGPKNLNANLAARISEIEFPAVSLLRREKVGQLLNRYPNPIYSSTASRTNPLLLIDDYTVRSILNTWIVRASNSTSPFVDPLIPSWNDHRMLESFLQRQLMSESCRMDLNAPVIRTDLAKEAGCALALVCKALASEIVEYRSSIGQELLSGEFSDVYFQVTAKETATNGIASNVIVIDWAGRSQVYVPTIIFNKLRNRFTGPRSLFLSCVFNTVTRYATRRDIVSGTKIENRLPSTTLIALSRELHTDIELFTDPLAVYGDHEFFGLFPDVDVYFGGFSSFAHDHNSSREMERWNKGASAVLLTGTDSHTTTIHLRKIVTILEKAEGKSMPLSFAVFIQSDCFRDWNIASSAISDISILDPWLADKNRNYVRSFEILPSGQHAYVLGEGDERSEISNSSSIFVLLQNDAGNLQCGAHASSIQNILSTLMVGPIASTSSVKTKSVKLPFVKEKANGLDTPLSSTTPDPSSPTTGYNACLRMSDFNGVVDNTILGSMAMSLISNNGAVTPVPTLSGTGSRRRERLFQLVDDGDDDIVNDTDTDVVSGMLRDLQNVRFLCDHDQNSHDIDIEAISLMGIVSNASLAFDRVQSSKM